MVIKKILWIFKRHPFLYLTRFRLLSKNAYEKDIDDCCYNTLNLKKDIPSYFFDINAQIFSECHEHNDLERVKQISRWLRIHISGGRGLSESSEKALRKMLSESSGVCSDIAQVFNNFCVINNVKVREWGVTMAPFDKSFGGHSFNEVYIKDLKKWVLVDVSYCMLFYDEHSQLLSVIELYNSVRNNKPVFYTTFGPAKDCLDFYVQRNYLNAHIVPFVVCNYRNKVYDTLLDTLRPIIPIFAIHFMLFLVNKSYHYRFPLDDYRRLFS